RRWLVSLVLGGCDAAFVESEGLTQLCGQRRAQGEENHEEANGFHVPQEHPPAFLLRCPQDSAAALTTALQAKRLLGLAVASGAARGRARSRNGPGTTGIRRRHRSR